MKWAYHTTLLARLGNIKKKGLIMHSKHRWPDRIWFCESPNDYIPSEIEIQLKFPWPEDAQEDWWDTQCPTNYIDPREFYVKRPIPANTIYKYFKKRWVRLV